MVSDPTGRAAEYALELCLNHAWHSLGERGMALRGLLATGIDEHADAVRDLIDHAVATQTDDGNLSYDFIGSQSWDDVVSGWTGAGGYTTNIGQPLVGQSVLEVYEDTGEDRYLEAARRQYAVIEDLERTVDGGIPARRERIELWIDSVDMLAPFLARYGVLADESDAVDDAVTQIEVHADHLHEDASGLYRHIWCERPDFFPESSLWSRGNGWMLAGMADTLRYLPDDHDDRDVLEERFVDHAAALRQYRDDSGLWRNVLDDPHAPLEVSGSCQFAHAYATGVELGLLPESYATLAADTLEVATGFVGADGEVKRVAQTPGGPNAPIGGGGQGQSWFLVSRATIPA